MTDWDQLCAEARARALVCLGGFHPDAADPVPATCQTMVLLGPDEPGFWSVFGASPEYQDGAPDPMNRWSERVIGGWADSLGAMALYPFGGPPYQPFLSWAPKTGRIQSSPIQLLVHDVAGLFVSFRGALAFAERIDLPGAPPAPCPSCDAQPCRSACPVDAFASGAYDVPRCKSYLDTPAGRDCMDNGCKARRACPVSQSFGRLPAQSAFHMRSFHTPCP